MKAAGRFLPRPPGTHLWPHTARTPSGPCRAFYCHIPTGNIHHPEPRVKCFSSGIRVAGVAVDCGSGCQAHLWAFAPRQRGIAPPFDGGVSARDLVFTLLSPLRPASSGAERGKERREGLWRDSYRGYKPRSTRRLRGAKAAEAASEQHKANTAPRKTATLGAGVRESGEIPLTSSIVGRNVLSCAASNERWPQAGRIRRQERRPG